MDSDGPTADALKNDLLRLPIEEITRIFAGRLRAAYTFVTDHIVGVLKSTIDKSDYEKALMATYGRIYLWVEAIVALKESRHFQVVHAGGRSIFELLLDLKLLSLDPSSAEKFHAFTKIDRFKSADRLARFLEHNKDVDRSHYQAELQLANNRAERDEFESLCERHWGRTGEGKPRQPRHWYDKIVEHRASDAGYAETYARDYKFQSWHVHGGAVGIGGLSQEDLTKGYILGLVRVYYSFLDATALVIQEFKLDAAIPGVLQELRKTADAVAVRIVDELLDRGSAHQ